MVTVYAKRHDGSISVLTQALRLLPDVTLVVIEPEERRQAG